MTKEREYPLNFIEAFNAMLEEKKVRLEGTDQEIKIHNDQFLSQMINSKFRLDDDIIWYEADKVHLIDENVVVEMEVLGRSKEDVIRYIDENSIGDFEILNWKTHKLPFDPNFWHK